MTLEPSNLANDLARDLSIIEQQERQLVFPHFNFDTAWRFGSRLHAMARERNLPVVIDIRRFGQPLFYCALANTSPDNVEWVRRKSNVVARFHRSSYAIGLQLKQANSNLLDKYGLTAADYASHGGSFPLAVKGAGIIGSITVSGLPQRADHELVVEALCNELDLPYPDLALPR